MSVEYRHTDTPTHVCVHRTSSDTDAQVTREPSEHSTPTARARAPLSARIERTQLELRVTALERELEASELERQEIIDRYEFVIQNRESSSDESTRDESSTRDRGILERLRQLLA